MFVGLPDAVAHREPWHLSFENRFSQLARGAVRVAYFYERPDNSTFRYRIFNMIDVINSAGSRVTASYFTLADELFLSKVADAADIIVICRVRYGAAVAQFIQQARRRGIKIIFDVDDFVFNSEYTHLIMNTLDQSAKNDIEFDFWFAYISRLGATLKLCDGAITTNLHLSERITDFCGLKPAIVPNFMNGDQIELSHSVMKAKRNSGFARDKNLHIGYFSGSPTHAKDFALASSSLLKIVKQFANVKIRLVGYLEPDNSFASYTSAIDRQPFHDYVNLQRLIGSTEINIAPLQDNIFTNCKSELKYFEAAITGTNTIASPSYTFLNAISHGRNGRIAASHQWEDVLIEAIEELTTNPERYIEMAEQAFADANTKFHWESQVATVMSAIGLGSELTPAEP